MELLIPSDRLTKIKQPLILAVDDDEDNLLLLTEVLQPLNCSVVTATYGQEAVELAIELQPSLILLDVMLPDICGIEVLYQLKHNPQTMTTPVIAVTALAREEDREQLLQAGCNDYVSKPYMLEDLEAVIYRYLNPVEAKYSCWDW